MIYDTETAPTGVEEVALLRPLTVLRVQQCSIAIDNDLPSSLFVGMFSKCIFFKWPSPYVCLP